LADCARQIADAFAGYNADFRSVTRRAPQRFETLDWKGSQRDAVERIDLYDRWVDVAIAELRVTLGERALERDLWIGIRRDFAALIDGLPDNEFTKTFFSSITRRLFGTVGVAPEIEFVATELDPLARSRDGIATRRYRTAATSPC
jgi:isocitrate dehydrogenase kinase/phosphatase